MERLSNLGNNTSVLGSVYLHNEHHLAPRRDCDLQDTQGPGAQLQELAATRQRR